MKKTFAVFELTDTVDAFYRGTPYAERLDRPQLVYREEFITKELAEKWISTKYNEHLPDFFQFIIIEKYAI